MCLNPPCTSLSEQYGVTEFNLGGLSGSNATSPDTNLSGKGSSFLEQFGQNNFNLSEDRKNKKEGGDVAGGINAGAAALDSVTGFFNAVMGNGGNNTNNSTNYNTEPPPAPKVNPLLIGGIVGTVFIIIIVLILTKNGQSKP